MLAVEEQGGDVAEDADIPGSSGCAGAGVYNGGIASNGSHCLDFLGLSSPLGVFSETFIIFVLVFASQQAVYSISSVLGTSLEFT